MVDITFFKNHGPFSLKKMGDLIGQSFDQEQGDILIKDVSPLDQADADHLTFFHNVKYLDQLVSLKAAACVIHPDFVTYLPPNVIAIISLQPYRDYAKVAEMFYPIAHPKTMIHPTAVIAETAIIGKDVIIGPYSVIGEGVQIGNECVIDSHVTITHTLMGKRCHVKAGARLGQQGFGFHMDEKGHFDVPQLGRLIIEDNVLVGANTTIDRGSSQDTVIESGARIDNLVQIGHNVKVGENCVLVAQVGIAGSTKLGKFVIAAGQAGIAGHLKIGDFVQIAAQSGVARDIEPRQKVGGTPAVPIREWHKQTIELSRLVKKNK